MPKFKILLLLVCMASCSALHGQDFIFKGKVIDEEYPNLPLQQIIVVNLRTQQGIFGNTNNEFEILSQNNDTLMLTAYGYSRKMVFVEEKNRLNTKNIVPLHRLYVRLDEITIKREREIQQIKNDIAKLGYEKKDFKHTGIDAWQSPITALYESFSKREKNKRKVAEWINTDNRNELIKELLDIYNKSHLIELENDDYNSFITFLNIDDLFLKMTTDYELAIYIKEKYNLFASR